MIIASQAINWSRSKRCSPELLVKEKENGSTHPS